MVPNIYIYTYLYTSRGITLNPNKDPSPFVLLAILTVSHTMLCDAGCARSARLKR